MQTRHWPRLSLHMHYVQSVIESVLVSAGVEARKRSLCCIIYYVSVVVIRSLLSMPSKL